MPEHARVSLADRVEACPQCAWHAELDHGEWNYATRGETEIQRLDRNFIELLQEMRVVQTGVQILFAFLLGFAFTSRFHTLHDGQRAIYLVTLVLGALTAGLLIAPVSHHRMLFRRRLKPQMVDMAHRMVTAGLVCLLFTLVGAVQLAATFVVGGWAIAVSVVLAMAIAAIWWGVPVLQRSRHRHE
jgi:O-antigen/teichoic acid export membrane protein